MIFSIIKDKVGVRRLADMKFGQLFVSKSRPGLVCARVRRINDLVDISRCGPGANHVVVIADDDEYNTQDTYLPTGTMFELDRGTEVELVEWADGAPAFVK